MRRLPRITTRGYYDLETGQILKEKAYALYPPGCLAEILGTGELAIMVHGLRNDRAAAAEKFRIAASTLKTLGYRHPVAGFSYDSNTRGGHIRRFEERALRVGQVIARKNGRNLACFVSDARKRVPGLRVRLLGHSLGSLVILGALQRLADGSGPAVRSVHFFGASLSAAELERDWDIIEDVIGTALFNYYAPRDETLLDACARGQLEDPLGLRGANLDSPKIVQFKVEPENHRFASYAGTISSFP